MTDDLLFRLWGKTNELGEKKEAVVWSYHPAICHMIDVGYVAERWLILAPWILDRFCELAPNIEREILRRIIISIIALHDLGKVHRKFQSKSENGWNIGYGREGYHRDSQNGRNFDHGLHTARIIRNFVKRKILPDWKLYLPAVDAVSAHHGQLYTAPDIRTRPQLDEWDESMALGMFRALADLFDMPDQVPDHAEELRNRGFLMLLAGFASVADWLGSQSETFTFTPVASLDEAKAYLEHLRSSGRAEKMLEEAGLVSRFKSGSHDYRSLFGFEKLHPLQQRAVDVPFGAGPGAEMVIVEAPMGLGKTEIALYLAGRAIGNGMADGIYFALPTQASSNALFDRLERFGHSVAAEGSPVSMVLAHGSRKFNEKYRALLDRYRASLEPFERSRERVGAYRDDMAPPSEVITTSWLQSSKRMLLSGLGLGTIDQAMLGAISVKHAFVRLFALAGKVVVLDEVHAYDGYMNEIIIRMLEWLRLLDCKVILLSATLPRSLRTRLIEAYGTSPNLDQSDPADDPYPQIIYAGRNGVVSSYTIAQDDDTSAANKPPITISPIEVEAQERTRAGVDLACELVRNGGCVAWIRNTVREAQEAWELLRELIGTGEGAANVTIVHARYTRKDRDGIESSLVEILGKKAGTKRPERMIVIATQVIEQSIDIDFDAMISDLAPIDLLLQRAGRLWRHERSPAERRGHVTPILHVLMPTREEQHNLEYGVSAYVYDEETLARSAHTILDGNTLWQMPAACRSLVAEIYDRPRSYWTAEHLEAAPEKLEKVRAEQEKLEKTMVNRAKGIIMPATGENEPEMETTFSDDERDTDIVLTTRYGTASATVVLLRNIGGSLRFAGSPSFSLERLPLPQEVRRIIEIEEAVLLSSVSFPWYGKVENTHSDDELSTLDTWWRERHPYDRKIFLLLGADGEFHHPELVGHYRSDSSDMPLGGLVIRKNGKVAKTAGISFEDR